MTVIFAGAIKGLLIAGLVAVTFADAPAQAQTQPEELPNDNVTTSGAWFLCEFAHSKIPPDDNCRMLDDDGFMVKDGMVFHIKVNNSREAGCRGGRTGHCVAQGNAPLTADISEIGPIEVGENRITVRFMACSQLYSVTSLGAYIEIKPTGERCYWTPDKGYYLSKYNGPLSVNEE